MAKDAPALFATIIWTTAAACLPVVLPVTQWMFGTKVLDDDTLFLLMATHYTVGTGLFGLTLWFSLTYYNWRTTPPGRSSSMFKNPGALAAAIVWTLAAAYMPCVLTIAFSRLGESFRSGLPGMVLGPVGLFLGVAAFLVVLSFSMFYYHRRTQPGGRSLTMMRS